MNGKMNEPLLPKRIEKHDERHFFFEWTDGKKSIVPFFEVRFHCPCAACVDEKTGVRMLKREQVRQDIQPKGVSLVGRYALQIQWNDAHGSGMLDFDLLRKLCDQFARPGE
jgi:DUF971 family protein